MQARQLIPLVLIVWSTQSIADEPSLDPAVEGYGPTFPIDDRDVVLQEGTVYKAVFDVARYSDDKSEVNNRLVSVARYLNMHARNGVAVENMDLAMVVHGASVQNVLNNDAYGQKHGIENPNLELLIKLHDAGVKIFICGQSMAFGGINKSDLASETRVALSAMTMLTVLQNTGYALLP